MSLYAYVCAKNSRTGALIPTKPSVVIRIIPRKILGRNNVGSSQKEAKRSISGPIRNVIARTKNSLYITIAWLLDERGGGGGSDRFLSHNVGTSQKE